MNAWRCDVAFRDGLYQQAFQALDGLNKLMHSPYSDLEVNALTGMFSVKCICQRHGGKTLLNQSLVGSGAETLLILK